MIREAIEKAINRINLSEAETRVAFDEIMSGAATAAQIAAFLTALRMKGETVEEITGAAKVMREKAVRVPSSGEEAIVDTCGTGGSGIDTFNISTTAAFVIAGCGLKVAKHGNRAASGRCGSADVLEALGVKLELPPERVARCIEDVGIGFMYAPAFHGAMKHAAVPRKEIGMRTIFNILGPLSNPANATSHILGVYDEKLTDTMAHVLKNLGSRRAFVVHGMDGLDEITIADRTKVAELRDGRISSYFVAPERFGIRKAPLEDIRGGDANDNAGIVMSVLKGAAGPRRNVVLLNASAGLVSGFKAKDFKDGVRQACESIDSGRALDKLRKLTEFTNKAI